MQLKSKPSKSEPLTTSEEKILENSTVTSRQKTLKFVLFLMKWLVFCPLMGILAILALITLAVMITPVSNCANTAKSSEAKQYLSSINKGQQAFFIENSRFSNQIQPLGIGIKTQTNYYQYSVHTTQNAAFSYAQPLPEAKGISGYIGAVFLISPPSKTNHSDLGTTQSIICRVPRSERQLVPEPILKNGIPTCVEPSVNINK
ncbi:type IV pilin-like G/H family protein [Planktothrix pseudagardhii]|uniref:General secretion pathway protein H n=1 Tax=Planktothrix pseudagardhii TaxID=132604 RepID=A0A9W4CPQ1_9CYAN|nr:type IV pilin-like G/H family protein [Planktothrix pseudagardhii]CAD5951438.1 hypothetical protein NO713_02586 [Planktothrix pseudagardhii]